MRSLNGEEAKRAIKGEDIGRDDGDQNRPVPLVSGGSSIPKTTPAQGQGRAWRSSAGGSSAEVL